jgi:hypothetical protein
MANNIANHNIWCHFSDKVAPYIVIGYIVNHYCLFFYRREVSYVVVDDIVDYYIFPPGNMRHCRN